MEETGEKHKPASSLWQILSHVVSHNTHISPYAEIEVVMGTDDIYIFFNLNWTSKIAVIVAYCLTLDWLYGENLP
jgi:hypothetical protein